MTSRVFVVTFLAADGGSAPKIAGVYPNESAAHAAIERAKAHPAFGGAQDFFWIDEYDVGADDWPFWSPPG